jgi:hypothetical protein
MAVSAESKSSPEAPDRPAGGATRLPWTRSKALRFWMVAVATTALLETAVVALGAAFPAAAGHREAGVSILRVLAVAAALPLVFLALARFAESKYQRRPSKAFQAWHFGLYLTGTALASAGFLRHQANLDPAEPLLAAGEILLGAAALIFAGWIVGVILCTPAEDAPLGTF